MDARLATLIRDYQARVAEAVAMLEEAGIPRPASTGEWAVAKIPERGTLPRGFRYCTSRVGCAVNGAEWTVDFILGDEGRIDGCEPSRLYEFARRRFSGYGFKSEKDFNAVVRSAVDAGELRLSERGLLYLTPAALPTRHTHASPAISRTDAAQPPQGPMPDGRRRFIAWWQIVCGAFGVQATVVTLLEWMSVPRAIQSNASDVAIVVLAASFFAACGLFGVRLLRGADYRGLMGSAVCQGMQVIGIAVLGGPHVLIQSGPHVALLVGSGQFRVSAGFNVAFYLGTLASGPHWQVTINVLALAWMVMLLRYANERRSAPGVAVPPEASATTG